MAFEWPERNSLNASNASCREVIAASARSCLAVSRSSMTALIRCELFRWVRPVPHARTCHKSRSAAVPSLSVFMSLANLKTSPLLNWGSPSIWEYDNGSPGTWSFWSFHHFAPILIKCWWMISSRELVRSQSMTASGVFVYMAKCYRERLTGCVYKHHMGVLVPDVHISTSIGVRVDLLVVMRFES